MASTKQKESKTTNLINSNKKTKRGGMGAASFCCSACLLKKLDEAGNKFCPCTTICILLKIFAFIRRISCRIRCLLDKYLDFLYNFIENFCVNMQKNLVKLEGVVMIRRDIYLNKLIARMNNGLIKVITGIRRCGKSYLLFEIFYQYLKSIGIDDDHIIKISLDDRKNKKYRDPDLLYEYVTTQIKDEKNYYILLDEVQYVAEFEDVLNGFLHIKNADTYVTGSNAKFLSKDIITEFRGRGDEVNMFPLSFKEVFSVFDGSKEEAWKEYCIYGGLLKVLEYKAAEDKAFYLKNIFEETYLTDIKDRYKIKNNAEFAELLDILSSAIGSLTNPKKLSDTFKSVKQVALHPDTINHYLEYLADSFLISCAKRYDIKGKKYINTPSKYYFTDIGLRNARLNFRQIEETHIMENIIYNELKILGYNVDVGVVEYSQQENRKSVRTQAEIDFVCNKADRRYYIQSALSLPTEEKIQQEQNAFKKIDDSFKKIIIVKDIISSHYNQDGIFLLSLFDFLLHADALGEQ